LIASEPGTGSDDERRACAWAALNRARRDYGGDLDSMLAPSGAWSQQVGNHPPFSTAQTASDDDRALAGEILSADASTDPTGGAVDFDEPALQDRAAAEGKAYRDGGGSSSDTDPQGSYPQGFRFRHYFMTADQVRARWSASGSRVTMSAGRFEYWT
jgi:hypothetical protein